MITAATTLDPRRRLVLPKDVTVAAGLTAGPVVITPGPGPGELTVATPAAALSRLRRALATVPALTTTVGSLGAVLAARPGRDTGTGPATTTGALPADGPIVADTAVIVALLDGDPAADAIVPLLPRLLLVDAVTDELLHTVLDAGLPMDGTDPACFTAIIGTLTAIGINETGRDADWAPVRVLEYELTKAGVPTAAERGTLAVAATRGLPALTGRALPIPDGVLVTAVDYRTLSAADPAATADGTDTEALA